MKKRLIALVLSLACAAALLLPTFGQTDIAPVGQSTEEIHTHTETCGKSYGYLLLRTEPVTIAFEKISQEELIQLRANATRMETCTHENATLFYDSDTDVYQYTCFACYKTWPSEAAAYTSAIQTSAAIRAACTHNMGGWGYYTETSHIRECTLCTYYEIEAHDIVGPSCTENEHCSVCNAAPSGWAMAYGHEMGYVFSMDEYFSSGAYMHEYRCIRANPDIGYICDYVSSSSSCDMEITYWEPEENGVHECYNVCNDCWVTGDVWYENCSDAIYSADLCTMCDDPNSW